MTWLLASVRNAGEAAGALAAGADIVDFKDPAGGALGAVPCEILAQGVESIGGRCLTSAALGRTTSGSRALANALARTSATGVDVIKIALRRQEACLDELAQSAGRCALIAVLFAEDTLDLRDIARFAQAGLRGVMLDTAGKSGGGLRLWKQESDLRRFVSAAREHGLVCGLAGSLRREDVRPLLAFKPDFLGFRSALCVGGERLAPLDVSACRAIRETIPPYAPPRTALAIPSVDCPSASAASSGAAPW